MNAQIFRALGVVCTVGLLTISCEKEEAMLEPAPKLQNMQGISAIENGEGNALQGLPSDFDKSVVNELIGELSDQQEGLRLAEVLAKNIVEPSECEHTALSASINAYAAEFTAFDWSWYNDLATINYLATLIDTTPQYFGAEGELTNFAAKHKRKLESFYGMPDEITLHGQHTSTLQNPEVIYNVLITFYGFPQDLAAYYAEAIPAEVIGSSDALKTSPLLSLDGFASSSNLIVIGDGIVQALVDTGLDKEIVFAGILAHEWGHQLQFDHYTLWYGPRVNSPEATRRTELEADFFTGYYLTHKVGGTYNWKRVAQFLELFYNIGDCSFTSNGHHGTPLQRLAAAKAGYQLAEQTFPKGHILSANELHARFMASLEAIVATEI